MKGIGLFIFAGLLLISCNNKGDKFGNAFNAREQIKNMVKSSITFYLSNGQMPADCYCDSKLCDDDPEIPTWEYNCSWYWDDVDGIYGTITATSTGRNYAGSGKTIEYVIETEEFSGYGQSLFESSEFGDPRKNK